MSKTWLVLHKEWLELSKERTLLLGTILPPLFLSLLPVLVIYGLGQFPDSETRELGAVLADPDLAGMNDNELSQTILGRQFGLFLLIAPMIVPTVIASYSIVGEKTRRTLEPLLATPIRVWDLLLGKALAALIPAMIVTLAGGLLFTIGVTLVAVSPAVVGKIITPAWVLLLTLCSPPIALLMIAMCVAISSRSSDPRTAQQFAGMAVLPLMGLFFAQLTGLLVLSPIFALGAALVLALLALGAMWLATQIFQRETILTRWS